MDWYDTALFTLSRSKYRGLAPLLSLGLPPLVLHNM
jgi:hypothetical protein